MAAIRADVVGSLLRPARSSQCGFASDVVGNLVSEDDQKRKLELVAQAARQIWG